MSEPRAPLAPSHSFSGTSSSNVVAKFAKRRMSSTSTLDFFSPASSSFQPLPYTPHAPYGSSEARTKTLTTRQQARSHDALTIPGMDPQLTDPDVVFVHPPFAVFPNSHLYPDGISYQVMAENPEWFLDPNDFVSPNNTNPQATPYPPILEPPRGWCPAKKKDLKDRGSEGWPEGEEPRLRCTFCRRTYAGVNAKSMWRRHVYEKHKIAMSNRRDGNDRPRGRGSGKENKQVPAHRTREEPHDKLLSMEVAPQTEPERLSHKSRFRSVLPTEEQKPRRDREKNKETSDPPGAAVILRSDLAHGTEVDIKPLDSDVSHPSPPTSPQCSQASDPVLHNKDDSGSDSRLSPLRPVVPPSPYDPLATPSFRHSPPPLPSERPWRYDSPSHPLHPTRDYSLSMLVHAGSSPFVKLPAGLADGLPFQSSPFSTPNLSKSDSFKTPSSATFSTVGSRPWFSKRCIPSPLDKHSKSQRKLESPSLFSSASRSGKGHRRITSSLSDDWFSGDRLTPSKDSFAPIYPWTPMGSETSPSKSSRAFLETESPVLRSNTLPAGVGLGIGLLEPFVLPKEPSPLDDIDAEINEMLKPNPAARKSEPASIPCKKPSPEELESSPPPKKRRMSLEG